MYALLVTVMVLDGFFLAVVILLQSGKGGGLAAMGGGSSATDGIMAGRQATTVLTRATWAGGTAFMLLALVLSIMSSRSQAPQSILEQDFQTAPVSAPEPVLPGLGGAAGTETGSEPEVGATPEEGAPPP